MKNNKLPEKLTDLVNEGKNYLVVVNVDVDFIDPWYQEFLYIKNDKGKNQFEITSLGANKKEGGIGINKDISFFFDFDKYLK